MGPESKKLIQEAYSRLPKRVQEAITSANLAEKFSTISRKHNLHIDQANALETETFLVMLELEPTKNYLENIERELRLTRDEARSISDDVNESILKDIKDSLKETYAGEEEEVDEPVRINAGPTMKNPGEGGDVSANKEALLREIEQPSQPIRMPIRSSGLSNISEKLRDRDMQVMTESKHLDDLRRAEKERSQEVGVRDQELGIRKEEKSFVDDKLTKVVTAPKKEISVKLPAEAVKSSVVDPYREPAN